MRTEAMIRRDLRKLEEQRAPLVEELKQALARQTVKCQHCAKRSRVSALTLIQTYWYREPYSCTGGGRWVPGDLEWECRCGRRNRGCYDENVSRLRTFFKEETKEHND